MPKLTADNIFRFMRANVVTTPSTGDVRIPYEDEGKKLVWVKLVAAYPGVLTNKDPGPGDDPFGAVYYISFLTPEEAAENEDAFKIYWVEYKGNSPGTKTWLGNESPLMFTALMTGCSFGLGSKTPAGVMAAHVNSANESKTGNPDVHQNQDQYRKLETLGLTDKVVEMSDYLPGEFDMQVKTTPFGFREPFAPMGKTLTRTPRVYGDRSTADWKFYWQKFRLLGKNYTHMGVQKHAGGLF